MTLTEHETLNTTAAAFDVEYAYYAGPAYATLALTGLAAALTGWTAPTTGTPSGWIDITERVNWGQRFSQSLRGNSITWQAKISGWGYNSDIALGQTVLCWRRVWRPTGTVTAPAGWQNWAIAWVGEIIQTGDQDDYRAGQAWQRTVTGHNNRLDLINAPRITAGRILATDGATATGSDELALPESERDTGEFVGGIVNVEVDNVVDLNRNTVYISNDIPTYTENARPTLSHENAIIPSEIFFRPIAGWPLAKTWWIEVYNGRSADMAGLPPILIGNHADGVYTIERIALNLSLSGRHFGVICANRQMFDLYTGAGNSGAEWVIDLSEYTTIGLTADSFFSVDVGGPACAWAPAGANRTYVYTFPWGGSGITCWSGATFDSDTVLSGESIQSNFDGVADNNRDHSWSRNANPHPGTYSNGSGPIWIKVVLPENECLTLDEIDAHTTNIRLNNYRGWIVPKWRDGQMAYGVIAGCDFSYLGRNATDGLISVEWITAPTAAIPAGTRCYPLVDGAQQTGLPLTATSLVRRKEPVIKHYKAYWSYYEARGYDESGWASDYYDLYHEAQENTQALRLTDHLGTEDDPLLWVRTILYLIYAMSDEGRVKVNEIEAELAQGALDLQGSTLLDGQKSAELAAYLINTWAAFPSADFTDNSSQAGHEMGQHALAITPVSRVLDDLARATGCLVWYAPGGGVTWLDDPWWPKNDVAPEMLYTFSPSSIRGEVASSRRQVGVDFVVLNALSLEGDPHTLRYVYPQPWATTEPPVWAMVQEINDRVVSHDADAALVAQMELERLVLAAETASLTVKGLGEWTRPGQLVRLVWDLDGDDYAETTQWLIEDTETVSAADAERKQIETRLQLRKFRGALPTPPRCSV